MRSTAMDEWFRLFLRGISLETLHLELECIQRQWMARIHRNERVVSKLLSRVGGVHAETGTLMRASEVRVGTPPRRRGGALSGEAPSFAHRFQRLPESILVNLAEYLDTTTVLRLGECCTQGHACAASSEVWSRRPLNLSYIRTLSQWRKAARRGFASAPWKCATHVVAPKAGALRVAVELSAFFCGRLKVLDLTSSHGLALVDYDFFLRMRYELLAERPEKILLSAPTRQDFGLHRSTRRTLAKHLAAHVLFDFCG